MNFSYRDFIKKCGLWTAFLCLFAANFYSLKAQDKNNRVQINTEFLEDNCGTDINTLCGSIRADNSPLSPDPGDPATTCGGISDPDYTGWFKINGAKDSSGTMSVSLSDLDTLMSLSAYRSCGGAVETCNSGNSSFNIDFSIAQDEEVFILVAGNGTDKDFKIEIDGPSIEFPDMSITPLQEEGCGGNGYTFTTDVAFSADTSNSDTSVFSLNVFRNSALPPDISQAINPGDTVTLPTLSDNDYWHIQVDELDQCYSVNGQTQVTYAHAYEMFVDIYPTGPFCRKNVPDTWNLDKYAFSGGNGAPETRFKDVYVDSVYWSFEDGGTTLKDTMIYDSTGVSVDYSFPDETDNDLRVITHLWGGPCESKGDTLNIEYKSPLSPVMNPSGDSVCLHHPGVTNGDFYLDIGNVDQSRVAYVDWNIPNGTIVNRTNNGTRVYLDDLDFGSYDYSALVVRNDSCRGSDSHTVHFNENPTFEDSLSTAELDTACNGDVGYHIGDTVEYFYTIYDSAAFTTDYSVGPYFPTALPSNPSSFTFSSASAPYTGSFEVRILDDTLGSFSVSDIEADGCGLDTLIITNIVPRPMKVAKAEGDSVICEETGDSVTVCVDSIWHGTPEYALQWEGLGAGAGDTNMCYTIDSADLPTPGTWDTVKVMVSDEGGCLDSLIYPVYQNDLPDISDTILTAADSLVCGADSGYCVGSKIDYQVSVNNKSVPFEVIVDIPDLGINDSSIMVYNADTTMLFEDLTVPESRSAGTVTVVDEVTNGTCNQVEQVDIPVMQLVDFANQTCTGVGKLWVSPTCRDTSYAYNWSSLDGPPIESGSNDTLIRVDFSGYSSGTYRFRVDVSVENCTIPYTYSFQYSDALPDTIKGQEQVCISDTGRNIMLLSTKTNQNYDNRAVLHYWDIPTGFSISSSSTDGDSQIEVSMDSGVSSGKHNFGLAVESRVDGCQDTLTKRIMVIESDSLKPEPSMPSVCRGEVLNLHVNDSVNYKYKWRYVRQGNPRIVKDTVAESSVDFKMDFAGTYRFRVRDTVSSCVFTGDTLVQVYENPDAQPVISNFNPDNCQRLHFEESVDAQYSYINSTGIDVDTVHWHFSDGEGIVKNGPFKDPLVVEKSYSDTGTYKADLRIVYSNQCTYEDSVSFDVCEGFTIPNMFSPNGDGINDNFFVDGIQNEDGWTLKVFNRWGKRVYLDRDYNNDWSASNQPDGVYYFHLLAPDEENRVKGWVKVMR